MRLYKGEAFRLTLDDFSFTFDGAGDAVKVDSVYGDTSAAKAVTVKEGETPPEPVAQTNT